MSLDLGPQVLEPSLPVRISDVRFRQSFPNGLRIDRMRDAETGETECFSIVASELDGPTST